MMHKDLKLHRVDVSYSTYILSHKNDSTNKILDTVYDVCRDDLLVSDEDVYNIREVEDLYEDVQLEWFNSAPWATEQAQKYIDEGRTTIEELFKASSVNNSAECVDTGIPDDSYVYLNGKKYRLTLEE